MRESSFVCCCLRMSTFWVNYSVSLTVSLLTFIAPIQLCCESVVGHHMHVCSLYFLDVFRDDYAFIQQYYIYPSSYQKTFHSIYFHTALLHMGCEKITTQHMLHHPHSTPPLHGASSQGSVWSNATQNILKLCYIHLLWLANQQGEHLCNPQMVTEGNQTTVC